MFEVTTTDILIRLLLATVVAGIIGSDREYKNRPAGIRTHILVCLGACVVAMIQLEIGYQTIEFAKANMHLATTIRADLTRLIAQVVSGIGFLGAGTIIVNRRKIMGLTTAASLWATAGIGLAIGMGYYEIGVISSVFVILILVFLKKIIHINQLKKIEIKYHHKIETKEFIQDYFDQHHIKVRDVDFTVNQDNQQKIYTNIYRIEIPQGMKYADIVEDISLNKNIDTIRMVSV
ncbi:MgtC/SapB family protein [Lactobacillus sp. YT155]|uniref:MgtC/SapB family protein n=1 Tax=Lactobacillus sp. YT155 TaxID=3060955 RepID=UPI00265E2CE5|nr:MgtC/SapB family protein [Lactobacillus sp. YT155]MDO1605777.1 MgtC/SapB family protein [Lactobacillus sp. YT155]